MLPWSQTKNIIVKIVLRLFDDSVVDVFANCEDWRVGKSERVAYSCLKIFSHITEFSSLCMDGIMDRHQLL